MSRNVLPFVSVVIPVRNEEEHIAPCISQLLKQSYPQDDLEILVVDGNSEDRTRDIVEEIMSNSNAASIISTIGRVFSVRLLENPKGQRASGLNVGIKEAKGDLICRIDARTRIFPDYISKCVATILRTGADNVGGVVRPICHTSTQKAIGLAVSHPFGAGGAQFRLSRESGFVDTVYPGFFRRSIFDKVGLFDEEAPIISEDSDINQRIREAGGKVYLDSSVVVYYQPRESILGFWRLYFRYGGARAGNLLKYKKLTAWRQFGPPFLLASLVVLAILSVVNTTFLTGFLGLAFSYLLTNLAVCFLICLREKDFRILAKLFLAFVGIHLIWPLGFYKRLLERPTPGQYWGN